MAVLEYERATKRAEKEAQSLKAEMATRFRLDTFERIIARLIEDRSFRWNCDR